MGYAYQVNVFAWEKREVATGLDVVNPNMETL
jgi:hypothetical protein